ncbi:hypothetical protein GCM10027589_47660 [Actinocorallia lasiicapitis]
MPRATPARSATVRICMASTPPREASAAAACTMRFLRWCWLRDRVGVSAVGSTAVIGTPVSSVDAQCTGTGENLLSRFGKEPRLFYVSKHLLSQDLDRN